MPKTRDKIDKLPGGWNRILRTRHSGSTVGDKDIYIISPLGKKLRSTFNLAKHIEDKNLFSTVDPNLVNFERPGQTRQKTTKDFIQWLESGGKTKPKFLQRRPKKNIQFKCRQCEFHYANQQVVVQANGEYLCECCLIGRTDPFRVLKLFNDQNQFLPLENDAIKLQKQTGLSFGEITQWFTDEMQRISNDFDGIPDFEDDNQIETETDSMNDTKSQPDSLNSLPKNNEIVRKRRPINFSLEDLNETDSVDETWDRDPRSSGGGCTKTRILPRRDASSKIRFDEDFEEYQEDVQEEYPDLPPETSDRITIQDTIPSVESSRIQGGLIEVDNQMYVIKSEEALDDTLEETSKNLNTAANKNIEMPNMIIKEEPLEESNNINESDQPPQNEDVSLQCVTVKEEPLEENNQIKINETDQPQVSFQPEKVKVEHVDSLSIKIEINEDIIENDDEFPCDFIEEDDIPDDIG